MKDCDHDAPLSPTTQTPRAVVIDVLATAVLDILLGPRPAGRREGGSE